MQTHQNTMTAKEARQRCEQIWYLLPNDYEDAFTILGMVVNRFVSADTTGYNREHFIKFLQWAEKHD